MRSLGVRCAADGEVVLGWQGEEAVMTNSKLKVHYLLDADDNISDVVVPVALWRRLLGQLEHEKHYLRELHSKKSQLAALKQGNSSLEEDLGKLGF